VLVKIRAIAAEEHAQVVIKPAQDKPAARHDPTAERRTSELDGRPVVEVEVRARPRRLRCALAPHAAEVAILRPESRYHRLVFTVPEWDAFLADVKAGLYDVVAMR
jgi:hypothetical protein